MWGGVLKHSFPNNTSECPTFIKEERVNHFIKLRATPLIAIWFYGEAYLDLWSGFSFDDGGGLGSHKNMTARVAVIINYMKI